MSAQVSRCSKVPQCEALGRFVSVHPANWFGMGEDDFLGMQQAQSSSVHREKLPLVTAGLKDAEPHCRRGFSWWNLHRNTESQPGWG